MTQTILEAWNDEPPEIRAFSAPKTGEGVVDDATFRTIEVDSLFDAVNGARTVVGQATLYRSLTHPEVDLEAITAKQEAVRDLEANAELKSSVQRLVEDAAVEEKELYRLFYGTFTGLLGTGHEDWELDGYGYESYVKGTRFLVALAGVVDSIPQPSSPYLKKQFATLRDFAESRAYSLMKGPAYRSEKGMLSKQEKSAWTPAIKFRPTLFKPFFILGVVAFVYLVGTFYPLATFGISSSAVPVLLLFLMPVALVYAPIVGGFDRDSCIYPLRDIYKQSPEVQGALDALGNLDELLSFLHFAEDYGHPVCLPELFAAKHHAIVLEQVRNPILGHKNPDYVANDFSLDQEKLAFVTGPNSGGKTAFCKTIAQTQLLAQVGCFVPATEAKLAVADRIFYQVPEVSHLDDGEGRFGTELKRTKQIFLASSPRSLVILDELSEGTTYEEKLETSSNVLNGFFKKGNNTILITHNHELVDSFVKRNIGKPLQVEFAGDHPTYKLIPGISRVSHADRVAKKIGFSKEDIDGYLSDKPE